MAHDAIAVLDFGSQYTQLIARRIREANVYARILPPHATAADLARLKPKGIILSGGPASVYQDGAPACEPEVFGLGVPVLGICYGMQLMTHVLGGSVAKAQRREYGRAQLTVTDSGDLVLQPLRYDPTVWMSHGDRIEKPPPGFEAIAWTDHSPFAAIRDARRRLYGLQFHPEVVHTPSGREIINSFLFKVCGCRPTWTPTAMVEQAIAEIQQVVGGESALCALSGGVDSSVAAVLAHRALGDRLTCLFVDTGLLRQGEAERVEATFRQAFKMRLVTVNAADRFFERLHGLTDPEQKRRMVGEQFIRVFEAEAERHGRPKVLIQGTLYPDVIESRSTVGPSARIKTHHNVGGLPEKMAFKVVEPLRALFKDEVRRLGAELGLPDAIIRRQPFPGPGLAVRVLGEVTPARVALVRHADAIVEEEIRRAGLAEQVWQAFAVLLPVRTVGVMGDERTYDHVIAVRCVTSEDGMTADWARLPHDLLGTMANRIINEVRGVNRVVYDVSSKPPGTIEWE